MIVNPKVLQVWFKNHRVKLYICSKFTAPRDHWVVHKTVHFGCCFTSNMYCFHPILESEVLSALYF
ncbi:PREDICTED: divergent paired-related homeobox-like [Chinchilla lanigera]|uniref:divergent paired-related homeobox-like n=1 Tax=Chinchilla lanigera TaxID=34839 RepID=UPI000698CB8B|nr:PREDICTED: divergent paired-related homeobox-like [Chinchilla lanigera]